jgi:predicted GH43/DUF377 family glycosyl hydrolase
MHSNKHKWVFTCLMLCGCGRYADFTLPPAEASGPGAPFEWQASAEPVLARGPEAWDSVDVLNPSVFRFQDAYWNLYSGFDGKNWSTGSATSSDGVTWKKLGRVISGQGEAGQGSNGSVLVENGEILYWYVDGDPPGIALARSKNGVEFIKLPKLVVPSGPRGSFDERGVADPYVIRRGDSLYLFYLGQDRARRQTLGVARSRDGLEWEKSRANPVLELGEPASFDENGLGEPAVWTSGGLYWMLYTGRDRAEHRRLGLARSTDGVHWQREPSFTPVAGEQPWDSRVVCDPTVLLVGDSIRVWFGGGDVAHPVANIHGQIGTAILRGR